jgi:hypothetical protein
MVRNVPGGRPAGLSRKVLEVIVGELPPELARRLGWVAAAGLAALLTLMVSLVLARGADRALVMGADRRPGWPPGLPGSFPMTAAAYTCAHVLAG